MPTFVKILFPIWFIVLVICYAIQGFARWIRNKFLLVSRVVKFVIVMAFALIFKYPKEDHEQDEPIK